MHNEKEDLKQRLSKQNSKYNNLKKEVKDLKKWGSQYKDLEKDFNDLRNYLLEHNPKYNNMIQESFQMQKKKIEDLINQEKNISQIKSQYKKMVKKYENIVNF